MVPDVRNNCDTSRGRQRLDELGGKATMSAAPYLMLLGDYNRTLGREPSESDLIGFPPERSPEIVDNFAGKERGRPRAAQLNLRRRRIGHVGVEARGPVGLRQTHCQTARAAAGAGLCSSSRRLACAAFSASAARRSVSRCLAKGWPFSAWNTGAAGVNA